MDWKLPISAPAQPTVRFMDERLKTKIALSQDMETLLIPLHYRVLEGRKPHPILVDPKAEEILGAIDYDFSRFQAHGGSPVTVVLRAKKLDDWTREWIDEHPDGVVLSLGCGLDSRCLRVEGGRVDWYDLDFAEVIDLRRQFYAETQKYHLIPSSVTALEWMDTVQAQAHPVLVVAEGLFMYLQEAEVWAVFAGLTRAFPGCSLIFDLFTPLTVKSLNKRHRTLRQMGAQVHWGLDNAREIETWGCGFTLREEWFFNQSPEIARMGWGMRLGFSLAKLFPVAMKAHRLVYFTS